jgi:exodeoxyribonuclease-3
MTIITYNVNGIRSAISKGFFEWLDAESPDIICLQEIKAMQADVPVLELEALGYHHVWFSAEKKGYSGVAIFSKKQADHVVLGCGVPDIDKEGRIIRCDFGELTLLNCYFPSGTSGDHRQDYKMQFLDWFLGYAQALKKERPKLIVVGDYNIAHNEIDIHDPKGNKNSTGFLPEERAWMTRWFESGFTDAFRHANPDKVEYSWWSFRAGARGNNKGWRIDYQSVSEALRPNIAAARQMMDVKHSDHCPVWLELNGL